MGDIQETSTKVMFDCLLKLYKQGQLLLLDADHLMGEIGWEPMHNTAAAHLSNSLNSPQRWYARWVMRFYRLIATEEDEQNIKHILFLSIQYYAILFSFSCTASRGSITSCFSFSLEVMS